MTKYLWAAVAALGLALLGLGLLYRAEVRTNAAQAVQLQVAAQALEGVAKQRKKDLATLAARAVDNAAQRVLLAQAQEALHTALQADLTWSNTSVPTGVQKALREDSDGSIPMPD